MKKKIFFILYIIVTIILLYLLCSTGINVFLKLKYSKGKYSNEIAYAHTIFGFPEQYKAYYNCGNVLYKNGDYYGAIDHYKKALSQRVPERKECRIRVNYALSICKLVNVDESNEGSVKEAIKSYKEAISVLTEDGCAKADGNGHNKEAQQLMEDIQKEIDRLEQLQDSENNEDENDDEEEQNQDNPENSDDEKSKEIEDKIKDIKEEAQKTQRESESSRENVRKNIQHT